MISHKNSKNTMKGSDFFDKEPVVSYNENKVSYSLGRGVRKEG